MQQQQQQGQQQHEHNLVNTQATTKQKQQPSADRQTPQRCPICSLVAGEDYLHNPRSCFLDGTTPIPDWWRPNNAKILKRANELRKARNQPPLQTSAPVAPATPAAPASNPGKPGKAKQVGFTDIVTVVVVLTYPS
jgi:hypothetical protein